MGGVVTRSLVGLCGVQIQAGHRDFSLHQNTGSAQSPPILSFNGYWRYFPVVKRSGPEVNYSPPSSAEDEIEWSCPSTPHTCVHGVERDKLAFYVLL